MRRPGSEDPHWHGVSKLGRPLFLVTGPSGVRALPLTAGRNKGSHYFRYFSSSCCFRVVTTLIQTTRRGCHRVQNFCIGS
jgi:hypothetical protein